MTRTVANSETAGRMTVRVSIESDSSSVPEERLPTTMPASIPESQLYFWANDWQESEDRADADLEAGRSKEFNNFLDLARELLSPE